MVEFNFFQQIFTFDSKCTIDRGKFILRNFRMWQFLIFFPKLIKQNFNKLLSSSTHTPARRTTHTSTIQFMSIDICSKVARMNKILNFIKPNSIGFFICFLSPILSIFIFFALACSGALRRSFVLTLYVK